MNLYISEVSCNNSDISQVLADTPMVNTDALAFFKALDFAEPEPHVYLHRNMHGHGPMLDEQDCISGQKVFAAALILFNIVWNIILLPYFIRRYCQSSYILCIHIMFRLAF